MAETYTEPSLFPELAPERALGEDPLKTPDVHSKKILGSLSLLGITLEGESTTYYGRIKLHRDGLLDETRETADIVTPSNFGYVDDESWRFNKKGPGTNVEVLGWIESLHLFKIGGRPEPVLRTTPNITDMGIGDDHLVLMKHVQSIETLAPWVSEFFAFLQNEAADGGWSDELESWLDAFDNFLSDPEKLPNGLKAIWSAENGATPAWQ